MTDAFAQQHRRPRRSPLAQLRAALLALLLLVLAAASLCNMVADTDYWRIGLLAHFYWPFFALSALLALVSLIGRHLLLFLFALLLTGVNGSMLVHNAFVPSRVAAAAASGPTVRALSINVYSGNRDIERVVEYIRSQSPDIVALIEVTGNWLPALDALRSEYPYQTRQIWGNNFGSVLLSRYPLTEPPRSYGYAGVGSITRIAELPQGRCLLVMAHPIAPITERAWQWNAASLGDLGKYVNNASADLPVLVLGDLNASPWGKSFNRLLSDTSLRPPDSKRIWWPTWGTGLWPAAIPIDHFLLSPQVQDTASWVGQSVGSDHYPIGLDFRLIKHRP